MGATDFDYEVAGDQHTFTWPEYGYSVQVDQTRRTIHGLYGEVRVSSTMALSENGSSGHLLLDTVNLSKNEEKTKLAKAIGDLTRNGVVPAPWERMLEAVRVQVRTNTEAGRPLVRLGHGLIAPPRDLFAGIAPLNETTTYYGDGASGKSYFMVASAVAAATGMTVGPFHPSAQTNVLVLDGETGEDEWRYRLQRICDGIGIDRPENILYREIALPIVQDQTALRRLVAAEEIGYVIVDSIVPAIGGDVTAETAPAFFNALRTLGRCSRGLISHVAKATARDEHGIGDPFGSVFVVNLSRSVWALRRDDTTTGTDIDVSMVHRKVNRGRLQGTKGIRLCFDDDPPDGPVTFTGFNVMDNTVLAAHTRLGDRILHELRGGTMTVKALSEITEATVGTVYKTAERLVQRGYLVRLGGGRGAGKEGSYGLAAYDQTGARR